MTAIAIRRTRRRQPVPRRVRNAEIPDVLVATHDADAGVRSEAVRELCPCHVRADHEDIWDRIIEMAVDPDVHVRKAVLHALTDGSPRTRKLEVVGAIESMRLDPDPKVRRQVRRILTHYQRTGNYNIG